MIPSSVRTFGVLCIVALCLSLPACSEKEAEPPGDTTVGRVIVDGDTTAKSEVLRFVVGTREATGPDSLREIDAGTFDGWVAAHYLNVKVMCASDHLHVSKLPEMTKNYYTALANDCSFFRIDVPDDTIVVIYYTGPGQAWEITGMNHAFYLGDTLHNWPPEKFGTPLAKYLVAKWQSREPRHQFLKHGLYTLLDNSGENFHKLTLANSRSGKFVSLADLAVSPTIDSDFERQESAMAASFVDFIVFRYGIAKLADLYRSQEPFDQAVQKELGVSINKLQSEWLALLAQVVPTLEPQGSKK